MRNILSGAKAAESDHAAPPTKPPEVDRSFGVAISRAFDILHCFTITEPLLGISELGRRAGLPKATVARLTYTLEQLGYLDRSDPPGKYTLGWRILSLGYPLLSGASLRQTARPPMLRLATRLHANVNLCTLDRLRLIYIETVRHDDSDKDRSPDIGKSFSLLQTGSGRTLLAHMRGRRAEELANRLKVADPAAWAAAAPKIELCRDALERKGFYAESSVLHANIWVIAVPMKVRDHQPPMVFNCSMPQSQFTRLQLEREVGPMVVQMVREVEGQGTTPPA
jgi:DNA-binding IclR family transcriptional regulator